MKRFALIVAGGSGTRMGNDVPKQFLRIKGLPILIHTIRAFQSLQNNPEIILVLPGSQIHRWNELCRQFSFESNLAIIVGGNTRQQSVSNGLEGIFDQEAVVAIHDGVRPFVSKEIIEACYVSAELFGSGCAAVVPKDSIRIKDAQGNWNSFNRDHSRMIQTPQTFRIDILRKAYSTVSDESLTDDASIVERAGFDIKLVKGSYKNIKITTPEDLIIANAILTDTNSNQ